MAQKNFATAPKPAKQPTDEQIAAFERGGTGHDKHRQRASTPTKTEPTRAAEPGPPAKPAHAV